VPTWRLVGFFLFFFFFICQKTKTPPKGKNSREFFSDVRSERIWEKEMVANDFRGLARAARRVALHFFLVLLFGRGEHLRESGYARTYWTA
jgi:hypothetical protein